MKVDREHLVLDIVTFGNDSILLFCSKTKTFDEGQAINVLTIEIFGLIEL